MLVALELQDSIDDVLKHLRASERSLLGDVSDEDDRRTRLLGELEDASRTFTHLPHTACTRLKLVGGNGLDGVDDEDVGLNVGHVGKDLVEVGFAGDKDMIDVARSQARGTQLELIGRFLARTIEHLLVGDVHDGLQDECRFADARVASQEHHRTRH